MARARVEPGEETVVVGLRLGVPTLNKISDNLDAVGAQTVSEFIRIALAEKLATLAVVEVIEQPDIEDGVVQ